MLDFLSEKEKLELEKFAFNKTMREAVKKVVLDVVYQGTLEKDADANPTTNFALMLVSKARGADIDNEALGRDLRAIWEGINLLEGAFQDIMEMAKKPEVKKKKTNDAR